MSAADEAYARAVALTLEERGRSVLSFNSPEFHALEVIPKEVAERDALGKLDLRNTNIRDLAPLRSQKGLREILLEGTPVSDLAPLTGLTGLEVLHLNRTSVSNLSSLSGLMGLRMLSLSRTSVRDLAPLHVLLRLKRLYLDQTSVSDLAPLRTLTALEVLSLDQTSVSDLDPLRSLTGLEWLWLKQTTVTDLSPLSALTGLGALYLDQTAVSDLRPLRGLRTLVEAPFLNGLSFKDCAACKANSEIAEISEIEDNKERAARLFAYLKDWVPPAPPVPVASPAPVSAEIREGRLVSPPPSTTAESAARRRAEQGWQALRLYRQTFGNSFNTHNYAVLSEWLSAFDAAMGDGFDPDRAILIGSIGSAIAVLAEDAEFTENLPAGAKPLLGQFGVQIEVYLNRFEEWLAYKEDAAQWEVTGPAVAQDMPVLRGVHDGLASCQGADARIVRGYEIQLEAAIALPSDDMIAKGIIASTREIVRPISERAIDAVKSGEHFRNRLDQMDAVHDGETAKWFWRGGGWTLVWLRRKSPELRQLANRYPGRLGWLHKVLDYIGGT